MITVQDLIKELRYEAADIDGPVFPRTYFKRAADALEAQAAEIERLKAEASKWQALQEATTVVATSSQKRCDALQSKLNAMPLQRPIGEFRSMPDPMAGEAPWLDIYNTADRIIGRKIYAIPKEAEPLTDAAPEMLDLPKCQHDYKWSSSYGGQLCSMCGKPKGIK